MYFSSIWILFGSNLSYQACCAQDFCKFLSASIAVVPTVPMSCSVLDFFFFFDLFLVISIPESLSDETIDHAQFDFL